jgi:serine/threonine protein kinase
MHPQSHLMPLAPNTILGEKYRLLRPLDEAKEGSVWLAEHLSLAAPVAVKLMSADFAKTSSRLRRFLREARAAAAARSPNVVQILDFGVDAGTPYIVMELLEGESLKGRLLRVGRLSPRDTEGIIRQVSRGLTRAHDSGIVHRDLKPANIFITRNEDEEVIKLFDFGIAKAATELSLVLTNQTRTGSIFGTPYYMSPEQMEASRRCDLRTDIWAMGVITFECLLGRLPFVGTGIGGLVLAVCSHPVPVPSAHGEVPEGFDAWFARACARNRRERFATAREAAQELRRLVEPGYVVSRAVSEPSGSEAKLASTVLLEDAADGHSTTRAAAGSSTPARALESTASAASSSTVARPAPRVRPKPWVIAAPIVGCMTLAIALHEYPSAPAGADRADQAVQALEPVPHSAGLRVLGEGSDLSLSVDGKLMGALPGEVLGLDPGEHWVLVTGGPRYRPFQANVNLAPGTVASVGPVKLEVAKGLATIALGPGAEGAAVSLKSGDTEVPLPPLPLQLDVETGKSYAVLARKAGFAAYEAPLTFEDGQAERTFSIELTALAGGSMSDAPAAPLPPDLAPAAPAPAVGETSADGTADRDTASAPASGTNVQAPRHSNAARRRAEARATSRRSARQVDPRPTTLSFLSSPRSAVLLDGTPMGTTPLRDVTVEPGSHRVIFIHGARRQSVMVVSTAGKRGSVSTRFPPSRGGE